MAQGEGKIVRLTNCRLAIGEKLVRRDLWVSGASGKILDAQQQFFDSHALPSETRDLGGRIVAPGFIEVQLNGAFGLDFSVPGPRYGEELKRVNRGLIKTGVTSYLPTLTSQKQDVYKQALPFLGTPSSRDPHAGAESLGAHVEGPFINPERNGIHKREVMRKPTSIAALEECYGREHLCPTKSGPATVKYITLAPELAPPDSTLIHDLRDRGILVSIGHSAASHSEALKAISEGATMVTHLYNAMSQPHHRDTGIFGLLGEREGIPTEDGEIPQRPYFGIIADGIHVHPSMVRVAYRAHPSGCILVTDAMSVLGLPDGDYAWTNGEVIEKRGPLVTLKGANGKLAGNAVTLITCIENLLKWTGISIPEALQTVTSTPAKMLEISDRKGGLKPGMDADIVVLNEITNDQGVLLSLEVEEVWKFGVCVHQRSKNEISNRLKEKERKTNGPIMARL